MQTCYAELARLADFACIRRDLLRLPRLLPRCNQSRGMPRGKLLFLMGKTTRRRPGLGCEVGARYPACGPRSVGALPLLRLTLDSTRSHAFELRAHTLMAKGSKTPRLARFCCGLCSL